MSFYRQQIVEAIRAAQIRSPTRFDWFGQRSPRLDPAIARSLDHADARAFLYFILRARLYSGFYTAGRAVPAAQDVVRRHLVTDATPFVQSLTEANNGAGYWQSGWVAEAVEQGMVIASRKGLRLRASIQDCMAADGDFVAPGTTLKLHLPKELLGFAPGFYVAVGNTPALAVDADREGVRLYWHLSATGAVRFVRQVTETLNRAGLPFRLKVVNDPDSYSRCDAGVLYIARADFPAVAMALEPVYFDLAEALRSGTPALTKALAHGLGLAEGPDQEVSFGMHRCGLMAEGLIRAYEQHQPTDKARLRAVENCFFEAGVSVDMPYLNPGSRDDYAFQPRSKRRTGSARDTKSRQNREFTYLSVAEDIGRRLVREAIWHEGRCTWIEATLAHKPTSASPHVVHQTLSSDLYSGTSGIAWFLADLAATTGDAAVHRTALGAMRQALARSEKVSLANSIGLYLGQSGIPLAAAHIGTVLRERELVDRAGQLIHDCLHHEHEPSELDLLGGHAGAIVALLTLHSIIADARLVEFAARMGDTLVRETRRSGDRCSWGTTSSAHQPHMLGFAHGAAGIGYGLLELFRATHESAYRDTAEAAFRYERSLFDEATANWPDFGRAADERRRTRLREPVRFGAAWCRGAAGIALSRLQAYALLGDESCEEEAIIGLLTTHKRVEELLATGTGDFSLCHGLAGNAEILIRGEQILRDKAPGGLKTARTVADAGAVAYAESQEEWPCGTSAGETPGLMLGLAGIGHFYLRLHDPSTPSILLIQPENRADQSGEDSVAGGVMNTRSI